MPSYKITSVRVEISPGVVVTAEVSSPADIKDLLETLGKEVLPGAIDRPKPPAPPARPAESGDASASGDSPDERLATRASIPLATLRAAKIVGFKDGTPQLFRPGMFASVSDATISLLYTAEIGMKRSSIAFDDFRALFEAQNIKTGSPLPMLLSNLHNTGYIDKKAYSTDRTVRLTAKGEKKAEEVLTALCGQKA